MDRMDRKLGFTPRMRRKPRMEPPVAPGKPLTMCPLCGKGPIAEGELCGWCGERAKRAGQRP